MWDGDLGLNMARGARALDQAPLSYPLDSTAETLKAIGINLQDVLPGSGCDCSGDLADGITYRRFGSDMEFDHQTSPAELIGRTKRE